MKSGGWKKFDSKRKGAQGCELAGEGIEKIGGNRKSQRKARKLHRAGVEWKGTSLI